MAQAERVIEQVERKIETTVIEEVDRGVKLHLDDAEAAFLADLMARVGGMPETSRRGYADRISDALRKTGRVWNKERAMDLRDGPAPEAKRASVYVHDTHGLRIDAL